MDTRSKNLALINAAAINFAVVHCQAHEHQADSLHPLPEQIEKALDTTWDALAEAIATHIREDWCTVGKRHSNVQANDVSEIMSCLGGENIPITCDTFSLGIYVGSIMENIISEIL